MVHNLDDVDRGIIHLLQQNARDTTAAEMGERVGTSASTVRNRIQHLEETIIRGYHPEIDYEAAGFDLHLFVVCRAPTAKRSALAREALTIPGVTTVRELTTGDHTLHIEAVAVDISAADETVAGIEALAAVELVSTQLVNSVHIQPFNHFGADVVE